MTSLWYWIFLWAKWERHLTDFFTVFLIRCDIRRLPNMPRMLIIFIYIHRPHCWVRRNAPHWCVYKSVLLNAILKFFKVFVTGKCLSIFNLQSYMSVDTHTFIYCNSQQIFLYFSLYLFIGIIISTLVVVLLTCFLSSYAFQATLNNFNSNCITDARIAYKRIQTPNFIRSEKELETTEFYNRKINETFDEFQKAYMSSEMKSQLAVANADSDHSKTQIFQMWRSEPVVYRTTTERASIVSRMIPLNDSDFFQNGKLAVVFVTISFFFFSS